MAGTLGGFGQVVRLDHGYQLVTKYGHTSKILVQKGQQVKRGDLIARMGSSGRSTGPHLHYQVEVAGKTVNPRLFILNDNF
jgi:murein DD-endopeptidase MepM/ murein hydrolase activator NlpD